MSSNRKQRQMFNEINITPLTDIFLVLLIIMMVIAPLLDQQGLKLMVPNEQEVKEKPKETKTITIEVSPKGEYLMDGKSITAENLVFSIQDAAKVKKDGLLIQAAGDATHGDVVKVMDAARNVGIANISVYEKQ
ncbi:MAG: biopolymer transporter ExbD [Candidatus Gastranaerophilales bacterium]|nr:biopolymer transporter ExbD [Candidatus Gastranaerophilales bacterium]